MMDEIDKPTSLSIAISNMTKTTILATGGNTGISCANLAYYLRYRKIILTGLDLGYTMNIPVEKSQYYPIIKEADPSMTPAKYKEIYIIEGYNPDFKVKYYTDVTWKSHIDEFIKQTRRMAREGVKIINATEGGALHGGAIVPARFEEAIKNE